MAIIPEFTLCDPKGFDLTQQEGDVVICFTALDEVISSEDQAHPSVAKLLASKAFEELKEGTSVSLTYPADMKAQAIHFIKMANNASSHDARSAGAKAVAKSSGEVNLSILAPSSVVAEVLLGAMLRHYTYDVHKSDPKSGTKKIAVVADLEDADVIKAAARAAGVHFTRDLVNAPANDLTTTRFAEHLEGLREFGVTVEVLEEDALEKLGMGALLGVGQGSDSPSKVVVMTYCDPDLKDEAPLAYVGKGVVFDTGGISLKPAAGMEDMTMDMGGAGVVAGVMRSLAQRKAKTHVVGIVGLVENMPSGGAQRPGDVVTSMKGDTIEVLNTDAEGRLVLADILWHVQKSVNPSGIVDLATLTGAMIIALGHENAGLFANDDAWSAALLDSAKAEGEGLWRLPLGKGYDDMLKSPIADMKNIGGRAAGSITAAQFLQRFIEEGRAWAHIDIAGVASLPKATDLAPKGATGWGVLTLDRLAQSHFEK